MPGKFYLAVSVVLLDKIYKSVEYKTSLVKEKELAKYIRQVRLDFINWCINKFQ